METLVLQSFPQIILFSKDGFCHHEKVLITFAQLFLSVLFLS